MLKFNDRERIAISLFKQYVYCKRRFCLMNIDMQWESNFKTDEGDILHRKVDDPFFNEKRRDIYTSRSVSVYSDKLNIYGVADIVEFIRDENGIKLDGKRGKWRPVPIEYKNGKPEENLSDNYQLCAVGLCIEEMFGCTVEKGYIYYGKLRRRKEILFDTELREAVKQIAIEMENLIDEGRIVSKRDGQNCSLCSLINICQPNVKPPTSVISKISKLMGG